MAVPENLRFPDAIQPGALKYACARTSEDLSFHFSTQGLRFDKRLLRRIENRTCHLYYIPTVRGFRADSESQPVQALLVDLEHLSFLSQRTTEFGDNLDMAKAIFGQLPRRIDITISTPLKVDLAHYRSAARQKFPKSEGRIAFRDKPADAHLPWAQDYVKSGRVGRESRTMTPRQVFEGRGEYGKPSSGVLQALNEKSWVRSKLAWDGGDLIFISDPRAKSKLLLVHGNASRPYWGESLSDAEYGYVLASEFGADGALNFGGFAPHVDYFLSFLPENNIALVATPLREDFEVSRAALNVLTGMLTRPLPPVLARLERIYETRESAFIQNEAEIRRLIEQARKEMGRWTTPVNADVYRRLEAHIAGNCQSNSAECVSPANLPQMIKETPGLLRDWVEVAAALRTAEALPGAVLSILESQLPGTPDPVTARIEEKIRELQQLGFRVIRVPGIGGDSSLSPPWAGIGYVNAALIDRTLFVPVFGLGDVETRIVNRLKEQLPGSYRVVPVFARYAQLNNGGAHCILAFLREPSPAVMTSENFGAPEGLRATPGSMPLAAKPNGDFD